MIEEGQNTLESTVLDPVEADSDRTESAPKRRRRGRPKLGARRNLVMAEWMQGQIDVLTEHLLERGGRVVTASEVTRDLVFLGMLAMRDRGVDAPGFDPAGAKARAEQ